MNPNGQKERGEGRQKGQEPLKLSMSCFSALAEFGRELAKVFMLSDSIHALLKC